jgi:iron complex transport system permease protein
VLLATIVLAVLLAVTVLASATMGPARIPLSASAAILVESVGVTLPWSDEVTETQRQIVRAIRLPRIIAAALVGAALALVGATMQALFRNPLADPGITGVSAGGALGAVLVLASGLASTHWLILPSAAFLGALVAALLVFAFALRSGRTQIATLLLGGIAISYLASAATSAIISFTYERDVLREILFWLLGGFENRSWQHVQLLLGPLSVGTLAILSQARVLNLLLLGEEDAQALGVSVRPTQALLLGAGALMAGAAVSVCGPIGFVGLVVPHLVRILVGPDHRALLPLAGLGGAVFLVAADTLARTLIEPLEIRVGIVTALVGSPVFLFLLARHRSRLRTL